MRRGQTTIDFTLGVVIFVVAILFAFTFVPGILSPFELSGSEDPALSDRIADSLVEGTLGSPAQPHALDRYCTVEFFDDSRNDSPPECAYSGGTAEQRLGLDDTQGVNVTLTADLDGSGGASLLCWQSEDAASGAELAEAGSCAGSDAVTLATGGDPPSDTASTVTARRVVSVHGRTVTMEVVVW